jgi:hypothetical protein
VTKAIPSNPYSPIFSFVIPLPLFFPSSIPPSCFLVAMIITVGANKPAFRKDRLTDRQTDRKSQQAYFYVNETESHSMVSVSRSVDPEPTLTYKIGSLLKKTLNIQQSKICSIRLKNRFGRGVQIGTQLLQIFLKQGFF